MKFLGIDRLSRHTTSTSPSSGRPDRKIDPRHREPAQRAKAPTGCFKPNWTL